MKFQITDSIAIIGTDQYNWTIQETRTAEEGENKGEQYTTTLGYYPSLSWAKYQLAERFLKTEGDFGAVDKILTRLETIKN